MAFRTASIHPSTWCCFFFLFFGLRLMTRIAGKKLNLCVHKREIGKHLTQDRNQCAPNTTQVIAVAVGATAIAKKSKRAITIRRLRRCNDKSNMVINRGVWSYTHTHTKSVNCFDFGICTVLHCCNGANNERMNKYMHSTSQYHLFRLRRVPINIIRKHAHKRRALPFWNETKNRSTMMMMMMKRKNN